MDLNTQDQAKVRAAALALVARYKDIETYAMDAYEQDTWEEVQAVLGLDDNEEMSSDVLEILQQVEREKFGMTAEDYIEG